MALSVVAQPSLSRTCWPGRDVWTDRRASVALSQENSAGDGRLGLSTHLAERVYLGGNDEGVRFGSLTSAQDQPGFYELQALEETGDLFATVQTVRGRAGLIPDLHGCIELVPANDIGTVVERKIATGGQGIYEPVHDGVRLGVVGDVTQDSVQHECDWLAEVQRRTAVCTQGIVVDVDDA